VTRKSPGHSALLTAASAEFAERGFDGTSIRDIAARAGVSLSALYHYYPGKQALLAALLDEGMDDYLDRCRAALAATGPGSGSAERLTALVAATVRYRAERSVASLILINEARALTDQDRAAYRERQREATGLFADVIEEGVATGEFRTPYPEDARRTVLAACNAVAQWYQSDGKVDLATLIERYVHLALDVVRYRDLGAGKAVSHDSRPAPAARAETPKH
jgi:AcrR family transcriptional regulator